MWYNRRMSSVLKFSFILLGIALAFVVAIVPSLQKIKEAESKAQVVIGEQIIIAEIAKTPGEKERGLSGVSYLRVNDGMLFIFDEKDYHSLWMKGMKIPIDIIWISGDEIVGFEEYVMPELDNGISELTIYKPQVPVDKILEVRAGRVKLLNAKAGDKVEIRPIIPKENYTETQY